LSARYTSTVQELRQLGDIGRDPARLVTLLPNGGYASRTSAIATAASASVGVVAAIRWSQ
jgi:hypothetical protein